MTFIPVANPQAYDKHLRFVERNLNRCLYPKDKPAAYEDHLDTQLCAELDNADVLLDIHSYHTNGGAFGFIGTTSQAEIDYAIALGLKHYVYGWSEAFSNDTPSNIFDSMGTTEYTRHIGDLPALSDGTIIHKDKGGIAITLECGQHDNPDNAAIAYDAIIKALIHLGMIKSDEDHNRTEPPIFIQMQTVFIKEKPGRFVQDWGHCDTVQKGQIIAIYDDGEEVRAPEDGLLVLPYARSDHSKKEEWFYFGKQTDSPPPKN